MIVSLLLSSLLLMYVYIYIYICIYTHTYTCYSIYLARWLATVGNPQEANPTRLFGDVVFQDAVFQNTSLKPVAHISFRCEVPTPSLLEGQQTIIVKPHILKRHIPELPEYMYMYIYIYIYIYMYVQSMLDYMIL